MLTEVTFAMDSDSGAPFIVGSMLVPHTGGLAPRWVERGHRTYVTVQVRQAVAESLAHRLPQMHRSIRCIEHRDVAAEQAG